MSILRGNIDLIEIATKMPLRRDGASINYAKHRVAYAKGFTSIIQNIEAAAPVR